jgi:hypothetical protein
LPARRIFLGFLHKIALLDTLAVLEQARAGNGTNTFGNWFIFFYYYAFNGYTINESLREASRAVGYTYGWLDSGNRLRNWSNYIWYPRGGSPENQTGRMRIYGNGNIYILNGV